MLWQCDSCLVLECRTLPAKNFRFRWAFHAHWHPHACSNQPQIIWLSRSQVFQDNWPVILAWIYSVQFGVVKEKKKLWGDAFKDPKPGMVGTTSIFWCWQSWTMMPVKKTLPKWLATRLLKFSQRREHSFSAVGIESAKDRNLQSGEENLPSPHRNNYFKPVGNRQQNLFGAQPLQNSSQRPAPSKSLAFAKTRDKLASLTYMSLALLPVMKN